MTVTEIARLLSERLATTVKRDTVRWLLRTRKELDPRTRNFQRDAAFNLDALEDALRDMWEPRAREIPEP